MLPMLPLLGALVFSGPSDSLVDRAQAHFERHEYASAERLLLQAHARDPKAGLLFGIGQAARLGGDCGRAIEFYERFAAQGADGGGIERATAGVEECRAVLAAVDTAAAEAKAGDVTAARARLVVAQGNSDAPELLLARAGVELVAQDCDAARALLAAYDEAAPESDRDGPSSAELETCGAPTPPAPALVTQPPPSGPSVSPQPPDVDAGRPERSRPRIDRTSAALLGTGGALTLVGAGLLVGAVLRARPRSGLDEAEFAQRYDTAAPLQAAGWSTLAVGGALIVGGVIRWAIVTRR